LFKQRFICSYSVVPQPHSSSSKPPLGSHPHIPKFSSKNALKRQKGSKSKEQVVVSMKRANEYEQKLDYNGVSHSSNTSSNSCTRLVDDSSSSNSNSINVTDKTENSNLQKGTASRILCNPRIHNVFLGVGDYENLVLPNGKFGIGLWRINSKKVPCWLWAFRNGQINRFCYCCDPEQNVFGHCNWKNHSVSLFRVEYPSARAKYWETFD
jgi:hypothetical protein